MPTPTPTTDTERLDALERVIADYGGIVLHDGWRKFPTGLPFGGLATEQCRRTLRQAIDQSLLAKEGE